MEDLVAKKVQQWEAQLIDLSLRNRLLNYKKTKSATLIVRDPDPVHVFKDLVVDRIKQGIWCEKFRDDFKEIQSGGRECQLYNYVGLASGKEAPSTLNPYTEKVLGNLRYKAGSYQREQGINALFVAFGELHWKEDEKDDMHIAPILLVPVSLVKKGVIGAHTLQMEGDEVFLNPALVLKAKKELGLALPSPPEDLDAFDVKAYVQNLHPLFARRNGWSVTMEQPFIGLFTFAKVVIYEDMLLNEGEIAKHPVLRAMAGDPTMLRKPSQEADLGEPDPLRTFQVLDADSSQMDAIEAVKRGDNLVLQGPPGTGKSQTITNIIAETLAQGRTVLFVSEKMAALEVVKRRLDQCGLGDHCLELHSTAPNKQEVLGSMLRPLQATDAKLEGTEEYRLNQLKGVRNELNSYLLALHRKSSPLGMSAFQAHGELASLYDHQQLVFDFKEPFGVDQTRLDRIVATLRRLTASREVVSKREQHPWRDLDLKELSLAQQGEMLVALEDLDRSSDQLDKELTELCGTTALARPQDAVALRRFLPLLQMAARSPSPPSAWFDRGKIRGYREDVAGWRSALVRIPELERDLSSRYKKELLALNGMEWADRFEKQYSGAFRMINSGFRKDSATLKGLSTSGTFSYEQALADLRKLRELQEGQRGIMALESGVPWLGRYNSGRATDLAKVSAGLEFADAFMNLEGYDDRWRAVAEEGSPHQSLLVQMNEAVQRSLQTWDGSNQVMRAFLLSGELRLSGRPVETVPLTDVSAWADIKLRERGRLGEWVEFLAVRKQIAEEGLGPFFDEVLRRNADLGDLEPLFLRRFWQLWLDELYKQESLLARFNPVEQNDRLRRFQDMDRQQLELARTRVNAILQSRVRERVRMADLTWTQGAEYLKKQYAIKRRAPVRELLVKGGPAVQSLKPCFLMSPISVSQFLVPPQNGGLRFDLVVFDEASQIVPEDAVCCIMRGAQVVVVGDNKQLPPTRFFDKLAQGEYDEEEQMDLESVLDECGTIGLRQKMLMWHFRSRQESLISFSNYHFYENRLQTFPNADASIKDAGIEFVHVPDGRYDRGGKRDNRFEAAEVAELVIALYLADPKRTIGVVAFSEAQQEAIIDLLEYKTKLVARDRPEIEQLWETEGVEPFFVKNLENVQGDERDVMVFSIGYGRDEGGKLTMNFGPLNQEGGARRLNVAITRARKAVKVVSSILPEDIQTDDSSPRGLKLLRDYLDYARAKGEKVALTPEDVKAAKSRQRLEDSVQQALEARGYTVARRVGASAYRVDLAIMDPKVKNKYVLGILCDGEPYAQAKNARDRERLRSDVLGNLSWKLVRLWSEEWVRDRDHVMQKLEADMKAFGLDPEALKRK
jgi:hypothetical protein